MTDESLEARIAREQTQYRHDLRNDFQRLMDGLEEKLERHVEECAAFRRHVMWIAVTVAAYLFVRQMGWV